MKAAFGRKLLAWYWANRRDLPWRRTRDPYHIWVSEIMLQQTRVDTAIPYFNRFVERFPTVRDLAEAPEAEVLKLWEGLGYYSRARNLQAAARQVVERHGGRLPADREALAALKGIGPYTVGAILSIAFNVPEPAVDGNVMRVLARFFGLEDDVAKPATRTRMEALACELIPDGHAGDFNQALMELGALICTPRSPQCAGCPVAAECEGRRSGRAESLPVKSKAKPPRPQYRLAALVEGTGPLAGRVLVRQRPAEGLLARLWELPHVETPDADVWSSPEAGPAWLAEALAAEGLRIRPGRFVGEAEHVFSHLHWHIRLWTAEAVDGGGVAAGVGAGAGSAGTGDDSACAGDGSVCAGDGSASAGEDHEGADEDLVSVVNVGEDPAGVGEDPASVGGISARAVYGADPHGDGKKAVSDSAGIAGAPGNSAKGATNAPGSGVSTGAADGQAVSYRWISREEFETMAWPNVFRKLLAAYFARRD